MGNHILINDDNQTEVVGHILGFDDTAKPEWAIQRPDGQYWAGSLIVNGQREFLFDVVDPLTFITRDGAQLYIDSMQRSTLYRKPFTDCTPVEVVVSR